MENSRKINLLWDRNDPILKSNNTPEEFVEKLEIELKKPIPGPQMKLIKDYDLGTYKVSYIMYIQSSESSAQAGPEKAFSSRDDADAYARDLQCSINFFNEASVDQRLEMFKKLSGM